MMATVAAEYNRLLAECEALKWKVGELETQLSEFRNNDKAARRGDTCGCISFGSAGSHQVVWQSLMMDKEPVYWVDCWRERSAVQVKQFPHSAGKYYTKYDVLGVIGYPVKADLVQLVKIL